MEQLSLRKGASTKAHPQVLFPLLVGFTDSRQECSSLRQRRPAICQATGQGKEIFQDPQSGSSIERSATGPNKRDEWHRCWGAESPPPKVTGLPSLSLFSQASAPCLETGKLTGNYRFPCARNSVAKSFFEGRVPQLHTACRTRFSNTN